MKNGCPHKEHISIIFLSFQKFPFLPSQSSRQKHVSIQIIIVYSGISYKWNYIVYILLCIAFSVTFFFCGSHLCDVCVSSSCYCQVVFHFINTQNCYLFFPLLVPILVVSSFELCVEQLWTFLSKSFYKYMFLFLLDKFLKIKLLGQKVGIYIMNMPNLSLKLLCHFIF